MWVWRSRCIVPVDVADGAVTTSAPRAECGARVPLLKRRRRLFGGAIFLGGQQAACSGLAGAVRSGSHGGVASLDWGPVGATVLALRWVGSWRDTIHHGLASAMNTLSLPLLLAALFVPAITSCASTQAGAPNDSGWSGIIDAEDPRSAAGRAILDAYQANDAAAMGEWISDGAEILFNTESVDKATFLAGVSQRHVQFEIALVNPIVTTMIYNNGSSYTNLWTSWKGVARTTGEEVEFPVQMYLTWEDGQVATFMHFFDPGPLDEAIESL